MSLEAYLLNIRWYALMYKTRVKVRNEEWILPVGVAMMEELDRFEKYVVEKKVEFKD
jgi:hypothetical protein